MFSAMSYGSISYNDHASLARATQSLGILYITARAACTWIFIVLGPKIHVQVASGRFGCTRIT
jgi:glutamate synthase domain-containing protein 2